MAARRPRRVVQILHAGLLAPSALQFERPRQRCDVRAVLGHEERPDRGEQRAALGGSLVDLRLAPERFEDRLEEPDVVRQARIVGEDRRRARSVSP